MQQIITILYTECEKVIDVVGCPVNKESERCVAEKNNVEVFFHRTEFYGLCKECKDKKDKKDIN